MISQATIIWLAIIAAIFLLVYWLGSELRTLRYYKSRERLRRRALYRVARVPDAEQIQEYGTQALKAILYVKSFICGPQAVTTISEVDEARRILQEAGEMRGRAAAAAYSFDDETRELYESLCDVLWQIQRGIGRGAIGDDIVERAEGMAHQLIKKSVRLVQ